MEHQTNNKFNKEAHYIWQCVTLIFSQLRSSDDAWGRLGGPRWVLCRSSLCVMFWGTFQVGLTGHEFGPPDFGFPNLHCHAYPVPPASVRPTGILVIGPTTCCFNSLRLDPGRDPCLVQTHSAQPLSWYKGRGRFCLGKNHWCVEAGPGKAEVTTNEIASKKQLPWAVGETGRTARGWQNPRRKCLASLASLAGFSSHLPFKGASRSDHPSWLASGFPVKPLHD